MTMALKAEVREGAVRRELKSSEAPVAAKRPVMFETLGVRRYISPSVRTSNQHTPKQTGQQGFSSVETSLCEKIKPTCHRKFAPGLVFIYLFIYFTSFV